MKRIFFLITLVVSSNLYAKPQSITGGDIWWDNVTKRFGVAVSSPLYNADILGSMHNTGETSLMDGWMLLRGSTVCVGGCLPESSNAKFRFFDGDFLIDGNPYSQGLSSYTKSYFNFDSNTNDYTSRVWDAGGAVLPTISNSQYVFGGGSARFVTSPSRSQLSTSWSGNDFDPNWESYTAYTISFWMKLDSVASNNRIYYTNNSGSSGTSGHVLFYCNSSGCGFERQKFGGDPHMETMTFAYPLSAGTWYYVVLQHGGAGQTNFAMWFNGVRATMSGAWQSVYTGVTYTNGNARLGYNPWGAGGIDGYIDDFRYDRGGTPRFNVNDAVIPIPSHPEVDIYYRGRLSLGLDPVSALARLHIYNRDSFNEALIIEGSRNSKFNMTGGVGVNVGFYDPVAKVHIVSDSNWKYSLRVSTSISTYGLSVDSTTGNIGLDKLPTSYKMDVKGDVNIEGNIYANNLITTADVNVTAYNGTLGQGTTFYSFTPSVNITLKQLSVTMHISGDSGSTVWSCGYSGSAISLTTYDTTPVGDLVTQSGNVSISAGNKVVCMISSTTQSLTPTGMIELMYTKNP